MSTKYLDLMKKKINYDYVLRNNVPQTQNDKF